MRHLRRFVATTFAACCLGAALPAADAGATPADTAGASPPEVRASTPPDAPTPTSSDAPKVPDATAARAAAAPGDVARALRRQQLFLSVTQTKSVQRRMRVTDDGIWGSDTVTAARRYQRKRGLAVLGYANVETLRRMGLKVADRFERQLWAARAAKRRTPKAPSATAAKALSEARTASGVPYRMGGTTTAGFDCSGLVQWAYKRAGRTLPRRSFDMYRKGFAITKGAIKPGDLVFFDAAGPGASHVGIVASKTTAVSATSSSGVVEHDISAGYWAQHYIGARRIAAR